jgi:hypothetical protein
VVPQLLEARPHVLELRQLHLQLGFAAAGMAREDVEDELGAVDDVEVEDLFQIARLRRRQRVVEDHEVGAVVAAKRPQLVDLALADERAHVRFAALLHEVRDGLGTGRARQQLELGQMLVGALARAARQHHADQNGALLLALVGPAAVALGAEIAATTTPSAVIGSRLRGIDVEVRRVVHDVVGITRIATGLTVAGALVA